jgi:hypothetical protein
VSAVCGTYGAYQAHRRRGETPCAPCRRANADYMAEIRRRYPRHRQRDYERTVIRNRALARLAELHPEEFEALLTEEARAAR